MCCVRQTYQQLLFVIILVIIINNRDRVSVAGCLDFPIFFRTSRLLASWVGIFIVIVILGGRLWGIVFLVLFFELVFLVFLVFSILSILGSGALGLLLGC